MTATGPTRALLNAHSMISAANPDTPTLYLLEMTLQTKIRVTHGEHLGVDAAVRGMASSAALPHGLVLKDEGTALGGVAAQTSLVPGEQAGTAALVYGTLVRRMTVRAGKPAFWRRVMIGKAKLTSHIRMAFIAHCFRCPGSGNGQPCPQTCSPGTSGREAVRRQHFSTRVRVHAAGAVAGLAARAQRVRPVSAQPRMVGDLVAHERVEERVGRASASV